VVVVHIAAEFAALPGGTRRIVKAQHIVLDFGEDKVALVLVSDQHN
jgi:hypothetical protein